MTRSGGGGWLKVYRSMATHRLWLREPFTIGQAWVDLLMLANYHDSTEIRGNRLVDIKRGQVLTSIESLWTRWRRDRKTVRAWLMVFERDAMLGRESVYGPGGGYTLLTIRNYETYQGHAGNDMDGDRDTDLDRARDGGSGRALDRALDRALPHFQEAVEQNQENQEGENGAHSRSRSGLREVKL